MKRLAHTAYSHVRRIEWTPFNVLVAVLVVVVPGGMLLCPLLMQRSDRQPAGHFERKVPAV